MVKHYLTKKPWFDGLTKTGIACNSVPQRVGNSTSDKSKVTCKTCKKTKAFI